MTPPLNRTAVGKACVVDEVISREDCLTAWKTLVVDELTFQTTEPAVFGGGDCVTGPYTLISALAAGKKAARFIDQYLEEGSCEPDVTDIFERLIKDAGVFDPSEKFSYPGTTHKEHPDVLSPATRIQSFEEVEGCLTPAQAQREADRCLRCYRIAVAAV